MKEYYNDLSPYTLPGEVWTYLIGHEGFYMISTKGRIKDRFTKQIMKQSKDYTGYLTVTFGYYDKQYVDLLVARTFFNNKNAFVIHKDNDKENNTVENLLVCEEKDRIETYDIKENPVISTYDPDEIIEDFEEDNINKMMILCVTTGEIFEDISVVKEVYPDIYINNIPYCCKGKLNYCGKLEDGTPLEWKFCDSDGNIIEDMDYKSNRKAIKCITTGEVFKSIREAAIKYNIVNNISNLSKCCRGKFNYCGKLPDGTPLVWRFCDSDGNIIEEREDIKNFKSSIKHSTSKKSIKCITTGEVFESLKEASRKYNISNPNLLSKCCRKKAKSCGKLEDGTKLEWRYCDSDGNIIEEREDIENYEPSIGYKKAIRCITTGEVFESLNEASRKYNISCTCNLSKCCRKEAKSCGKLEDGTKLEWEYVNK